MAIPASVFVLHGATIIPRVLNEPLEDRGRLVVLGPRHVGERPHVGERVRGLLLDRHARPFREDEVRFDRQVAEQLEDADPVDRAGGSGDRHDEAVVHARIKAAAAVLVVAPPPDAGARHWRARAPKRA